MLAPRAVPRLAAIECGAPLCFASLFVPTGPIPSAAAVLIKGCRNQMSFGSRSQTMHLDINRLVLRVREIVGRHALKASHHSLRRLRRKFTTRRRLADPSYHQPLSRTRITATASRIYPPDMIKPLRGPEASAGKQNNRRRHRARVRVGPAIGLLRLRSASNKQRRLYPCNLLPPAYDHIDVERIKLYALADAARGMGGDEG
jgi:hypothetical protein